MYPCVWCKTLCKNFEMLSHVDRNGKTSLFCSLCCTTSYKVKQAGLTGRCKALFSEIPAGLPSTSHTPSIVTPAAQLRPQPHSPVDFPFHLCTALHLLCVLSFSGLAEGLTRWIYFLYIIRARESKILTQLCDAYVFINTATLIQQKKLLFMRHHIWHKNYGLRSQISWFTNSATN